MSILLHNIAEATSINEHEGGSMVSNVDDVKFSLEKYMMKLQTHEASLNEENDKKFYRLIEQCMEQLFYKRGPYDVWKRDSGWSRLTLQPAEAARCIRENVRPLLAEALELRPNVWFTEGLLEISIFVLRHFRTQGRPSTAKTLTPEEAQQDGGAPLPPTYIPTPPSPLRPELPRQTDGATPAKEPAVRNPVIPSQTEPSKLAIREYIVKVCKDLWTLFELLPHTPRGHSKAYREWGFKGAVELQDYKPGGFLNHLMCCVTILYHFNGTTWNPSILVTRDGEEI